ncbi:MAG: hypothetical protein NTX64_04320 [Elusimicrobia bacterium]|nr:hypothetical protein [Elusimicrobiota bacterium]
MKKSAAWLLACFVFAPLYGQEVAPVRVQVPLAPAGAAAAAVQGYFSIGAVQGPALGSLPSASLSLPLTPSALTPSLIPSASALRALPVESAVSARVLAQPAITALPAAQGVGAAEEAGARQQTPEKQKGSAAAMDSLKSFTAGMEESRRGGADASAELSERFFNQAAKSPAATGEALDLAAVRLPPGIERVSVDTVRTAADIDRLLPDPRHSHNPYVREYLEGLIAGLKSNLSDMTPYRIYTYYDHRGGRLVGIDLAASPAIMSRVPGLEPHEVTLIRKLARMDPDIRVLVREDGKTPDLVIGGRIVEMKTFLGEQMTLEQIIDKADHQVYEHARIHGLGHGAAAVDLAKESHLPLSLLQQTLDSWQAGSKQVALDQVIFFAGDEMKVFQRRSDGTYEPTDRASFGQIAAQDRPLAPGERGLAQSLLRQSKPVGTGIAPAISDPKRAEAIQQLISDIKAGNPLSHKQDGGVWKNAEGLLPAQPVGYYREYTFIPPHGSLAVFKVGDKVCQPDHNGGPRGAERLIIGGGHEIYYTSDHYRSFTRLTILP